MKPSGNDLVSADAEHFGAFIELDRPRRRVFDFATDRKHEPVDLATLKDGGCELLLSHALGPEWAACKDRTTLGWTLILERLARTPASHDPPRHSAVERDDADNHVQCGVRAGAAVDERDRCADPSAAVQIGRDPLRMRVRKPPDLAAPRHHANGVRLGGVGPLPHKFDILAHDKPGDDVLARSTIGVRLGFPDDRHFGLRAFALTIPPTPPDELAAERSRDIVDRSRPPALTPDEIRADQGRADRDTNEDEDESRHLLTPARADPAANYRFETLRQTPANRIKAP